MHNYSAIKRMELTVKSRMSTNRSHRPSQQQLTGCLIKRRSRWWWWWCWRLTYSTDEETTRRETELKLSHPEIHCHHSSSSSLQFSSLIHSGYFYSASSSPLLLRGALDTARILCRNFTPKRHRQLWVKDLSKVPTWRLQRESNPWPFRRKASTLPMHHTCPHSSTEGISPAILGLSSSAWCLPVQLKYFPRPSGYFQLDDITTNLKGIILKMTPLMKMSKLYRHLLSPSIFSYLSSIMISHLRHFLLHIKIFIHHRTSISLCLSQMNIHAISAWCAFSIWLMPSALGDNTKQY